MRRRTVPLLAVLAAVVLLAPGCSLIYRLRPPAEIGNCKGPILSTDDIPGDFLYYDQIRISAPPVDAGMSLVTQKRGDKLVMIGFNSFGAKAFAITQTGSDTDVQVFPGPPLPMPPLNILRDLDRVRFFPDAGPPATNGYIEAVVHRVPVAEAWKDGRLVSKAFGEGEKKVRVYYERSDDEVEPADIDAVTNVVRGEALRKVARVVNERCGYEMGVVNVAAEPGGAGRSSP